LTRSERLHQPLWQKHDRENSLAKRKLESYLHTTNSPSTRYSCSTLNLYATDHTVSWEFHKLRSVPIRSDGIRLSTDRQNHSRQGMRCLLESSATPFSVKTTANRSGFQQMAVVLWIISTCHCHLQEQLCRQLPQSHLASFHHSKNQKDLCALPELARASLKNRTLPRGTKRLLQLSSIPLSSICGLLAR